MEKVKISDKNKLILEGMISFIITELFIYAFELKNNVVYGTIIIGILTFLIDFSREKINLIDKNRKRFVIVNSIFSLIFSLTILIQTKIKYVGLSQTLEEDTFGNFELMDILKYFIIYVFVWVGMASIYFIIEKITQKRLVQNEDEEEISRKRKIKCWAIYTGTIAVFYMIFFLIWYPGSVLADSFSSIYQMTGAMELNNHFPIVYTFFVGIFIKIGQVINNYNIGIALYSIVQIFIIAGILGYFVLWLKQKKVKSIYLLFTIIYFVGNALFATYAITMWKDPLFCAFLFLLMLKLYDVVESKGRKLDNPFFLTSIIILNLLISFFRNNGIFIIAIIGIILTICYRKVSKKFLIANVISIITIILIQGPLYNFLNIATPSEESLGIWLF